MKSKTKKNLMTNSPKSKKNDSMPYSGDGPINIEIEPGTARSRRSASKKQSSKNVRNGTSAGK